MGYLDCISLRALASSALALSLLAHDALARPSYDPKPAWMRNGPGKKHVSNIFRRAVDSQRRAELPDCAETLTTQIKAPKANPWAPLTNVETASVVEWLFAQADLNLTVVENATSWDNSMQVAMCSSARTCG